MNQSNAYEESPDGPKRAPTGGQTTEEALQESLAGLAGLSSDQLSVPEILTKVAVVAAAAIPGAEGAGVTLLEEGRADVIVASEPFVAEVDAIQYGVGQGPCITAAREGATVSCDSLAIDERWPEFGGRVADLGVHSALSLPLIGSEREVLGAMNIYARAQGAFDSEAQSLGELYAKPAAIAVQNAQVLAKALRLATQLQTALVGRSVIDRAVGILMGRTGLDESDALAMLRERGSGEPGELLRLAEEIVSEAVRLARSIEPEGQST